MLHVSASKIKFLISVQKILKDIKQKASAWNANLGSHNQINAHKVKMQEGTKRQKVHHNKKVHFVNSIPHNENGRLPPWAYKQFKV